MARKVLTNLELMEWISKLEKRVETLEKSRSTRKRGPE